MDSSELTTTGASLARREGQSSGDKNVGYNERMACAVGGPLLALYGLTRGTPGGLVLAAVGGGLLYRGMTGYCPVYNALGVDTSQRDPAQATLISHPTRVEKSVTINRPAEELYRYWRNFDNLACFMKHLESVRCVDDRHSHWTATAPMGATVEWDAEITEDRPNELIAWRSLEGSDVYNAGEVRFQPAPGDRGTEVKVRFDYAPPGGVVGAAVAKLFAEEPNQQVAGDLRRFKQMMESGELATVDGQTHGQRSALGKLLNKEQEPPGHRVEAEPPQKPIVARKKDLVTKASEDSFPASDPPNWTGSAANEVVDAT